MKPSKDRAILWIGGTSLPTGTTGRELESLGHPIHWVPASDEVAKSVATLEPGLVLVEPGKMTGQVKKILSALADLKKSSNFALFLIVNREPPQVSDLADGWIHKGRGLVPEIKVALMALASAGRFKEETNRTRLQLERTRRELSRLHKLVVRDDLTCLYNLRFFNRSIDTEHARAARFGRSYSLIFMDLDGLREVNARHGHLAGGQVLKQLGEFLNEHLRRIDIPARVGGDEFVIICPETSKFSARILADRLRQGIEDMKIREEGNHPGITASVGVASFPDDGDLPDQVLEKADRALYEAKSRGKNRVCCWGDFPADETKPRGSVHGDLTEENLEEADSDESEIETYPSG